MIFSVAKSVAYLRIGGGGGGSCHGTWTIRYRGTGGKEVLAKGCRRRGGKGCLFSGDAVGIFGNSLQAPYALEDWGGFGAPVAAASRSRTISQAKARCLILNCLDMILIREIQLPSFSIQCAGYLASGGVQHQNLQGGERSGHAW